MKRRKIKKVYSYQINLVPEKEGGYTVLVPLLPGCVSYGATIEEATENAKEAISMHLENLAAHKQAIPEGHETPVFTTLVSVTASHV
ncbi:MAG: type II toxin-antitoxin system HicB family antitoxin [Acidobacteria bacterium]|nr:type II toxin-antitoxin system HicB family antitoxin [Acidobacteriota bacterium]